MTQPKTFDVFLSHNSIDKPWVIRLKKALQGQGLKVWLDHDEIRPGNIFVDALEAGLENSKAVALIVSPEAISSGWVKEEYSRALSLAHQKNEPLQLIPVILRDAEIPGFLANRSWVDFRDESRFHQNLERLVWGISGEKPPETILEHFKTKKVSSNVSQDKSKDIAMELEYKSSVVLITSVDRDNPNFGTGFVIDQNSGYSYILTCAHVVRNAKGKEGKIKVNNVIAEEVAIGTEADDLAVLRVEGLLGTPLTRRNVGNEGMSFTSSGYQAAIFPTPDGSKESGITNSLHGELGELNFQRIRGQGFPIKLWTLKIKNDFLPEPGYSGAPVVVKTEAGEHVVIGVLSVQQRDRILAISIEVLDRVWPEQIDVRFTNRDDELKLIVSSLAPAYYLLDGPAGYGKSTLLRALRKEFSDRKWSCAYLVLDSSLELDELAEAVAENLSISGLLPSPKINQGAGYRLGSAIQKYWANNSQEGLVLLFDFETGLGNSELLERLLKEFIHEIEDSLENISPFDKGDNRFRVVIAGRYLNSYYNRLSIQKLPIVPLLHHLTPFSYDVIQRSSMNYLRRYRNERVRQIAHHILYLTGGHPGCMAKVLQLYKESGMSPEIFVDKLSDTIWNEIVKPVVNSIATELPTTFGVHKLMSKNVLRYMDPSDLRKWVDILEISEVRDASNFDEFDLSDELTGAGLLNWNVDLELLHDDITRRLICLGLRNDRRDEFVQLCRSAQAICEDHLHANTTPNPSLWAIEYLFQFLQQHALLISNSEQRRQLRANFISQLPKVLQWLVTGRVARERKGHLLRFIEQDWEFMFTVNYYLRHTEYNDDPVEELKSAVKRIL